MAKQCQCKQCLTGWLSTDAEPGYDGFLTGQAVPMLQYEEYRVPAVLGFGSRMHPAQVKAKAKPKKGKKK